MTFSFDSSTRQELKTYFLDRARQYEALARRLDTKAPKTGARIQGAVQAGEPIPVIETPKAKKKPGRKKGFKPKKKSQLEQSTVTL